MSCGKCAKHRGIRGFERIQSGCESGYEQLLRINLKRFALPGGDLVEQLLLRPIVAADDHYVDFLVARIVDIEAGFLEGGCRKRRIPTVPRQRSQHSGRWIERNWIGGGNEPPEYVVVRNGKWTVTRLVNAVSFSFRACSRVVSRESRVFSA